MDRKLQRHRADSLRQHGFLVYFFLATCARLSRSHSAFESTLNSSVVSYGIVTIVYISLKDRFPDL